MRCGDKHVANLNNNTGLYAPKCLLAAAGYCFSKPLNALRNSHCEQIGMYFGIGYAFIIGGLLYQFLVRLFSTLYVS